MVFMKPSTLTQSVIFLRGCSHWYAKRVEQTYATSLLDTLNLIVCKTCVFKHHLAEHFWKRKDYMSVSIRQAIEAIEEEAFFSDMFVHT